MHSKKCVKAYPVETGDPTALAGYCELSFELSGVRTVATGHPTLLSSRRVLRKVEVMKIMDWQLSGVHLSPRAYAATTMVITSAPTAARKCSKVIPI